MAQSAHKTASALPQSTAATDNSSAEAESIFLQYTGNAIPWYVRLYWIIFWGGAIAYVVIWLLPALQSELLAPP